MRIVRAMNATPATISAQSVAARLQTLLEKYGDRAPAPRVEPATVADWRDEAEDLACDFAARRKRRAGRPSVKPAPVQADVRPEMTAAYVAELRAQLGITAEMLGDAAVSAKARASQRALHSQAGAARAGGPSVGTEGGAGQESPAPPTTSASGQDQSMTAESASPIAAVHGEGTSTPAAGTPDPADMEGAAPPPSSAAPSGDFPAILRSAIAARRDAASTPKLGQVVGRGDEDYLERLVAMNRRGQFPTVSFGAGRGWGARAGP